MRRYFDCVLPFLTNYSAAQYKNMSAPKYLYVAPGTTGPTGCTEKVNGVVRPAKFVDTSYFYCPPDLSIYLGDTQIWNYYSKLGDAAPFIGLAHEWGHHVQTVSRVPAAQTPAQVVVLENQADCVAGAVTKYAAEQKVLEPDDDLKDIQALLIEIADADLPGREHGTITERVAAFNKGFAGGVYACNSFFPSAPLIT